MAIACDADGKVIVRFGESVENRFTIGDAGKIHVATEKAPNMRYAYIVTAVTNGQIGPASSETITVIAESEEQAKLLAVHRIRNNPAVCIYFAQRIGVMPEFEDE